MQTLAVWVGLSTLALEAALLWRAVRGHFLSRFPIFYSYVLYVFCSSIPLFLLYWFQPRLYPSAYWFCFLISILAEFAILVEISDHIFQPYPAIRNLGRGLTVLVSAGFALFFIGPALGRNRSPGMGFLDFSLRSSLTKAFVIVAILIAAHYCQLSLSRNVLGLVLGFSIYLLVNVANFAAAQTFGRALYAHVLWIMSPVAYALCLLVWTIAMWRYQPVPQNSERIRGSRPTHQEQLEFELARFDTALAKLLRK